MKYYKYILILWAIPLCAGENIDKILEASGNDLLENIQEEKEFSIPNVIIDTPQEEEFAVEDENEEAKVLEQEKLTVEAENSIQKVIVKETASAIQKQDSDEEFEKITPATEDLSILAQRPRVTQAPDSPTKSGDVNQYETLPLTAEEKEKIGEILMTLAENNVFQLLFQKKRLERLGHEIHHVHPVRFMGTVFSDPRLVYCMRSIRRSSFKWDGFLDGFIERIQDEAKAGNLNDYIPGLAEALHLKAQDLQYFVDQKNFEGLIVFLTENASP